MTSQYNNKYYIVTLTKQVIQLLTMVQPLEVRYSKGETMKNYQFKPFKFQHVFYASATCVWDSLFEERTLNDKTALNSGIIFKTRHDAEQLQTLFKQVAKIFQSVVYGNGDPEVLEVIGAIMRNYEQIQDTKGQQELFNKIGNIEELWQQTRDESLYTQRHEEFFRKYFNNNPKLLRKVGIK